MGSEGWGVRVRVRGDRDKLGWLPEKSRGGTVATHISESLASFTSSGRTTFLTCFSSTLRIISCKEQNMQPCFQTLKSYSEVEVETHEPHSQATHFDKGESLGMSYKSYTQEFRNVILMSSCTICLISSTSPHSNPHWMRLGMS